MTTTKEVFDLVSDCSGPESEYVRERLAKPDDEVEHALGSMTAEEVVQYLKDEYWSSQEAPEHFEGENAELRAHLATEMEKRSEDAYAKMEALLARLRK